MSPLSWDRAPGKDHKVLQVLRDAQKQGLYCLESTRILVHRFWDPYRNTGSPRAEDSERGALFKQPVEETAAVPREY